MPPPILPADGRIIQLLHLREVELFVPLIGIEDSGSDPLE